MYYSGIIYYDYYFTIYCEDRGGWDIYIYFDERNGKKYYDGTITYAIDIRDENCYNYFYIYYYDKSHFDQPSFPFLFIGLKSFHLEG